MEKTVNLNIFNKSKKIIKFSLKRNSIIFVSALLLALFTATGILMAGSPFPGIREFSGKFGEYTVKPGEDLYVIARNHGLAIEHFMFANAIPGLTVAEGRKIIVPTRRIPPSVSMANGLVLNLPERGIYLYKNSSIVKFYPAAIGAADKWKTPTGSTSIINKTVNPTWYPPEWADKDEPVAPGPENPLGDRWMGLGLPGYGIHATNNPSSIGLATSHGCIRLYPEMAHDLFERVYVGMPVQIIYEPVKIGYDPTDRMLYMEVFPDVYSKTSSLLNEANRVLAQYGLSGFVDPAAVKWIVERRRGIPEPILNSRVAVKIDGKKQSLKPSPLLIRGKVWVASDILRGVGAELNWLEENKALSISRADRTVYLSVRENVVNDNEGSAYLWQGKSYIPLSYVLRQLGVDFSWCGKEAAVNIYSPRIKESVKKVTEPEPVVEEIIKEKTEIEKHTEKHIEKQNEEDRDDKVNEEVKHFSLPELKPTPIPSPVPTETDLES
jgi:L,D-transpeptidase ErfK/SrfK